MEQLDKTDEDIPLNIVLPYFYLTLSMTSELLAAAEKMETEQLLEWLEVCEKALHTTNKDMVNNLARKLLPHVSYYLNEVITQPISCYAHSPIRIIICFDPARIRRT